MRMVCRLLEVSRSGYYRFLKAPVAARKVRRLAVEDAVVRIHAESRLLHSAPKIAHELPRLGMSAHRNTESRIMSEHGVRAKSASKWRPTTQSGHGHGASPDLLGRDFAAGGLNRKWLCDITYISTEEGFLYLAGVMDASSRSIVVWRMSDSLHASVALDALRMAGVRRNPPRGLVHHSDRGVQYACRECRECRDLLWEHGGLQYMRRPGNCYDNAMRRAFGRAEEGSGARPALAHARGGEAGDLRANRGLVPANEDPRLTRLRQHRGIPGGRENGIGSRWVSTGRVEVQPTGTLPQQRVHHILACQ